MQTLIVLDRRSFLDWIAEDAEPRGLPLASLDNIGTSVSKGKIGLIWQGPASGPTSVPGPIILVAEEELQDFLAWTTTYISSYSPFTAFFRILTTADAARFSLFEARAPLLPESLLTAMSGIAIAEAVVQTPQAPRSIANISIQACQATFSYAALRGLASGLHPADLPELSEAWARARQLTADAPLRLDPDSSSMFWMIVSSSLLSDGPNSRNRSGTWTDALEDLIQTARFDKPLKGSFAWNQLESTLPFAGSADRQFELPREEQLVVLDRTAQALLRSSVPRPLAEAWVGLLAARLANGSFDYIGVLDSVRDTLPGSLLWFALFACWRSGFDGLVNGRCLGRRVAREVFEPTAIFASPTCDISLAEYELLGASRSLDSIRTRVSSVIDVELLPLVSSKFRSSSTVKVEASRERSLNVNLPRLREALFEALQALDPVPETPRDRQFPRQRSLFESSQGKSSRGKKGKVSGP